MKKPSIEIFRDRKSEFRFRVRAANGQIIAQSEGYTTKAKCKSGIRALYKIMMPVLSPSSSISTAKDELELLPIEDLTKKK